MLPTPLVRLALAFLLLAGLAACERSGSSGTAADATGAAAITPERPDSTPAATPEPPSPPPSPSAAVERPIAPRFVGSREISPTLKPVGQVLEAGSVVGLELSGQLAVALDSRNWGAEQSTSALRMIDLSDPARPYVRSHIALPDKGRRFVLAGPIAWVMADQSLQAVDLSDPDRPVLRGALKTPGEYNGALAVRDGYGYLTLIGRREPAVEGRSALVTLDLSDPDAPRLLGQLSLPHRVPLGVELVGDTAYVLSSEGGYLQIVDVHRPEAPVLLTTIADVPSPETTAPGGRFSLNLAQALTVSGDRVFVAAVGGVVVFDASDPAAPRPLDIHRVRHYAFFSDIRVVGERIYLTDANYGSSPNGALIVLDVGLSGQAVEFGRMKTRSYANTVRIAGGTILVGCSGDGLLLLQEQPG